MEDAHSAYSPMKVMTFTHIYNLRFGPDTPQPRGLQTTKLLQIENYQTLLDYFARHKCEWPKTQNVNPTIFLIRKDGFRGCGDEILFHGIDICSIITFFFFF